MSVRERDIYVQPRIIIVTSSGVNKCYTEGKVKRMCIRESYLLSNKNTEGRLLSSRTSGVCVRERERDICIKIRTRIVTWSDTKPE